MSERSPIRVYDRENMFFFAIKMCFNGPSSNFLKRPMFESLLL
jgi:hypothetical protein